MQNRRLKTFLLTSAASAALFLSGAAAAAVSADILVVGSGGAGMAAAIEASEASNGKAKVVILEKLPFVGGTTLLASTAFNAGGSKLQPGYSAKDYEKKLLAGFPKADAHDRANIAQLAELSGPTADWLIAMGADMSRIINNSQMTPKDGSAYGAMIVPVLKKRVDALGIPVMTNTKVESLVTDKAGRVTGVRATTKDGEETIAAKAVILATGGFASNPKLVERFSPQWAGYPSTASVGATGDGILMAEKLGAKLDNMALTGPQTVAYDTGHGAVSLTNVRYNGAILVGKTGLRFTDELGNTAKIGADIKAQPDGVAFLIFDRTSARLRREGRHSRATLEEARHRKRESRTDGRALARLLRQEEGRRLRPHAIDVLAHRHLALLRPAHFAREPDNLRRRRAQRRGRRTARRRLCHSGALRCG